MKIRSTIASFATHVSGILAFTLASLAVLPADATDATTRSSSSSESESIPLWRRGISTWTGTGYLLFPADEKTRTGYGEVQLNRAEAGQRRVDSVTASVSAKPYSVPTSPETQSDRAIFPGTGPYTGSSFPGFQLPGIQTNPLVVDDQRNMMDGRDGLSESVTPIVSVLPTNQSISPIPGFHPITDSSEFELSAETVVNQTTEIDHNIGDALDDYTPTITDHIQAGVAIETPPLHEEALRWYEYPWKWFGSGWKNHAEFGLDGSKGNSDTLAIQTGLELKRKTDRDTVALDFDYRLATSQGRTTENNGRFNLDWDRFIGDTDWSYFGKFGMEWDTFKAFDLRLNVNGGLGYHWIRNDRTTLVNRFGAGASKEIGSPDDKWIPEAVFGIDGEHRINKQHKVKGKVDYFPAWDDFSDYRLVTDLAWEILLDDDENLSLKLAATDRYDSTPQGAKPNDLYYSLLLLVKF